MESTKKKGLRAAAVRGLTIATAALATNVAFADASLTVDASRALTGAEETYSFAFVGSDGAWDNVSNWLPATNAVPNKPNSNIWDPLLFDAANLPEGAATDISMGTVEGWNLRVGLYGGVKVTIGTLNYWAGGMGNYVRVDKDSQLVISGLSTGNYNFVGSVVFHVAAKDGISYPNGFRPLRSGSQLNFKYHLFGEGSVSYGGAVAGNGSHIIAYAEADMTHPAAKVLKSKKLVSLGGDSVAFKTASDSYVKVDSFRYAFSDGTLPSSVTISAADKVGTCQLVQLANDGVYLYWVDGPYDTTSISLNFTYHAGDGDDLSATSDMYGAAPWSAAPGSAWNNLHPSADGELYPSDPYTGIKQHDNATGETATLDDVTVTVSGSRGSWHCNTLDAASDFRFGYVDDQDSDGMRTPTVTVTNIPYEHYRVIVIMATDTENAKFGVVNINGKDYKGENGATVLASDNSDVWGSAGPAESARPLSEGVNYLVSPITSGDTATIIGKRAGSTKRGTIAAIQIVKQSLPSFEADGGTKTLDVVESEDIIINVTEDTIINLESAKRFGSVSVMGASGKTLTFTGAAFSAAQLTLACDGSGTILTAEGGAFSAEVTTILEQLTIGPDINLGMVALGGAASLAIDATAGIPSPSQFQKTLLQNGLNDKEVVIMGEGDNGISLDYSSNGSTKWTTHTVFDGGTHTITATSGQTNWTVCDNSSNSDPLWAVNDGTTLNLVAKDLGGWQGSKKANSCVIAVRDGGTLAVKNSGTSTFYYQGRFLIEPGGTMKVRLNSEDLFRINGGIYTDEAGAKYAQFYVPDQAEPSDKVASVISDENASHAEISAATDSTSGFGIYVGANATLYWDLPLRNANGAANIAKFGSGVWNMTDRASALASNSDWTGTLQLYAGTIRVNRYGIARTLQVKGDATLEASSGTMEITGLSTIDAGKTLTIVGGQVELGTLRPQGAMVFSGSGNKLVVNLAEDETVVTLNVSGDISASDVTIYEYGETTPSDNYLPLFANGVLTIIPPRVWVYVDENDYEPVPYASLQDAVDAVADGGIIVLNDDCGNAVVNAAKSFSIRNFDDYEIGTVTAGDGFTLAIDGDTYTATVRATTFTWAATGEGNWNDAANWTIDDGQPATRAPSTEFNDSVVLGDGAVVVLQSNTACPGFAVSGNVTIKGSYDFQLYGDITGEGTLTLCGAGLKNFSAQTTTIQPNVVFAMNDNTAPWLAANGSCPGFTLAGNVSVSGTFKNWDVAHTITGTTVFSGDWTLDGNSRLVLAGPVAVEAPTVLTISGFDDIGLVFDDDATMQADESASFVLATDVAVIIDNAGIAADMVTTTLANKTVAYNSETKTYYVTEASIDDEDVTIDAEGCNFTVNATTAAAIADATGIAAGSEDFAKAAIAYVVGGTLEEDGQIVIPTPTITVNGTDVSVTFTSDDAKDTAYTITCTLQYADGITSPMVWHDVEGATATMTDKSASMGDTLSDPSRFYQVVVTISDNE